MVKIFLQPNARLDTANAQVTAVSQTVLRLLPAGIQPPPVPILQLALSGLSESELNDVGLNFLRTQLVTVPGASGRSTDRAPLLRLADTRACQMRLYADTVHCGPQAETTGVIPAALAVPDKQHCMYIHRYVRICSRPANLSGSDRHPSGQEDPQDESEPGSRSGGDDPPDRAELR